MPQYSLQMQTIKFVSSAPTAADADPNLGQIIIIADNVTPDITNQLPAGKQFFLSAVDAGGGEDATIARTCISATYNDFGRENVFVFSPRTATNWSSLAKVTVLNQAIGISFNGYSALNDAPLPTANQIKACIQVCAENA